VADSNDTKQDTAKAGATDPKLHTIEQNARSLANAATDAQSVLNAVEAVRTIRDLQSKQNQSKALGRVERWAAVLAPSASAIAIFVSVGALAFQMYQFRKNAEAEQAAAETSQWRDAVKNLSLRNDSSVLSSAVQMQSFFGSPRYSTPSRAVASVVLPCVTSGGAFDAVSDEMRMKSNRLNEKDMVVLAQAVTSEDWDLYDSVPESMRKESFAEFLEDPSDMIADVEEFAAEDTRYTQNKPDSEADTIAANECERERWYNPRKRALTDSYNADTISNELAKLWHDREDLDPGPTQLDLVGIVLENADLSGVNFSGVSLYKTTFNNSDLTGADFSNTKRSNTKLDHAVFSKLIGYAGSKWLGANWWDADGMDCELAKYLQTGFPAPPQSSGTADALSIKACGSLMKKPGGSH
jgi:hypothetical protein